MQCPYCGADQEVCHDDGHGYDEGVRHEYECSELEALKASIGEPVAWRYKDSRGNYRYCGYKTGFDTEHPLLKPIPLYALTKDKPQPLSDQEIADAAPVNETLAHGFKLGVRWAEAAHGITKGTT